MPNAFTAKQRTTLTAIVDTYVAAVPRDDDPTGFFAAKGSDLGTDAVLEQYLITKLPAEQFAGCSSCWTPPSSSASTTSR